MEPGGMFDPLVAFRLNETAVAAMNGLISRLRARWPHIELPGRVGKSPRDPGPPTCLRCQIEDEIGLPYCDGLGPPRPAETYSANLGMLLNDQVAALRKRVEELEQELARGHNVGCDEALSEAQARAERAERERDELMENHQALGREYEAQGRVADKLQADLDAALGDKEVAERHYQTMLDRLRDENENLRVDRRRALALLEKRREESRG